MTLRWLTPILTLLLFACGGVPTYDWGELKLEDLPGKKAHPESVGITLLNTVDVRYESDPVSGEPVAVVTEVYRARLLVEEKNVRVHTIETEWHKLESFDARLIQPPREADGKPATKKMGIEKSVRGPSVDAVEYSTTEVVLLSLGKARAGSVYEKRTVHRVTAPRLISHEQFFAGPWPIVKASLTVSAPSDWTLEHSAQAMGSKIEWAPTTETTAGVTTLTWTAENVAPLLVESESPSVRIRSKRVKARLAAWKEKGQVVKAPETFKALSAYQATLYAKGTDDADPALAARATDDAFKKQVDELLAGVPDEPRAKAQKLYDWVRQNIRYVSVNLGLGGWVPTSAKETRARLYGDCKDKANLLKAMLAHAGIESRLGTLYSSSNGFRSAYDMPVVAANTNHVILIIDLPGGPVFADPTDRSVAFGTLPFRDQGAAILPISDDGSELIKTPESTSAQNYREVTLSLDLAADGTVAGEFKVSALGTMADYFRQSLTMVPEGRRGRVVSTALDSPLFTVGELNAVEALEPPDAKTPVVASGLLAATTMTNLTGAMVSLSLADLVDRDTPMIHATASARTSPVLLGARRQLRARVNVILGDGLTADALPDAVKIEAPFAKAQLQWSLADGVLSLHRDVEFTETRLDATKADEYRDFMTRVERASATPVVLQRGGGS